MRINYTYQYQDFPGAPGLTGISKFIGKLTSSPLWFIIFSVLMMAMFGNIMAEYDIDSGIFALVGFVISPVLVFFIQRFISTKSTEILQKRYIAKVNALKDTNPAKYYEIMMELQKRQSGR